MTSKTLYRATDGYTGAMSCWSPDLDTARAYHDNPGYGGANLVECVVADDARVLDLRGDRPLVALAEALGYDDAAEQARCWMDDGLCYVYMVWEERGSVRAALADQYDWVCHDGETFPEGATTWVRLQD